MRAFATSAAAMWLLAPTALRAEAEIPTLLASLARPAPTETAFVEVRFSRLLSRPLVSHGTLQYLDAATLVRNVDEPFEERTEVRGDAVLLARDAQPPRRFSLRRAPELGVLITSFRALLSGDAAALERAFSLRLERAGDEWRLALQPRDPRTRRRVSALTLTGAEGEVRCLAVIEPDHDASILLLGRAVAHELRDPPERAALEDFCRLPRSANNAAE